MWLYKSKILQKRPFEWILSPVPLRIWRTDVSAERRTSITITRAFAGLTADHVMTHLLFNITTLTSALSKDKVTVFFSNNISLLQFRLARGGQSSHILVHQAGINF